MKTRSNCILFTLLTGALILSACQPATPAADSEPTPEAVQPAQGKPAIDQDQPDDFATATFSLG